MPPIPDRLPRHIALAVTVVAMGLAMPAHAEARAPREPALRHMPRADAYPLSEAVWAGDTLYLSGRLGTSKTQANGIAAETRRAMDSIGATLTRAGLDFSHIAKCTVILADMAEWDAFNAVYGPYFQPGKYPARTVFAGAGLSGNGRVEIECAAYAPGRRR